MSRSWIAVGLAAAAATLTGCAGDYVARTGGVRSAYQSYDHARALNALAKDQRAGSKKDRLLYLLDRGMILHAGGRFDASIRVLAEAERLAAELEGASIGEEAGALFTNERQRAYRGEDFEKLMINVLQALNYAQLGEDEDALVEVRRLDERLRKMVQEEKKPYQQLAIARYLGGVLWEDQKEWDSAFIDYQKAYELNPKLEHLGEALLRVARKTGRDSEYERLKGALPDVDGAPLRPGDGEVVVVVERGLSPEKIPATRQANPGGNPALLPVPAYAERWSGGRAVVSIGGAKRDAVTVTSLKEVARLHLDDRIGRMTAKAFASTAVKAGLAAGAGALSKQKDVAAATFALLTTTNVPDLRSWLSLPAEFQVARFRLPAGEHEVVVETPGKTVRRRVEVRAGRVAVTVVRCY